MENRPLVSIAICTHNGEKYLLEQLHSILNQTYINLELIIVDDCSTDSTIEIIRSLAEQFPQIKLYVNEQNLGYVKNFEKAIGLCIGEYIALSDQDDIWDLDKISLLIANIGNHALIYHDSEFIDNDGFPLHKKLSETLNMVEGTNPKPFFFYNCISGHAILFKKSLVAKCLPLNKSFYHDWQIAVIATENGGILYLNRALVKYRQHLTSSTDFLRIKKKQAKVKSKELIDSSWLTYISKKLNANDFLNEITRYFSIDGQIKSSSRLNLLFLMLKNHKILFSMKKKSFLSKLFSIFKASVVS